MSLIPRPHITVTIPAPKGPCWACSKGRCKLCVKGDCSCYKGSHSLAPKEKPKAA